MWKLTLWCTVSCNSTKNTQPGWLWRSYLCVCKSNKELNASSWTIFAWFSTAVKLVLSASQNKQHSNKLKDPTACVVPCGFEPESLCLATLNKSLWWDRQEGSHPWLSPKGSGSAVWYLCICAWFPGAGTCPGEGRGRWLTLPDSGEWKGFAIVTESLLFFLLPAVKHPGHSSLRTSYK